MATANPKLSSSRKGLLRYNADIKSLIFGALGFLALYLNWTSPTFNPLYYTLTILIAWAATSMVHNHNHLSVFNTKYNFLNKVWDYCLTILYGYPVFAWIPTHNQNHHVYSNKEGDLVPSYGFSEDNNLLTLMRYPGYSGWTQQAYNFNFLKKLWKTNPKQCAYFISQGVFLILVLGVAFYADWWKALVYIFIPQQISLNTVLIFNYYQHIHCDEMSRWDHSRNAVGPVLNWLLLNNGYHTAHHEKPMLHWSLLKEEHERIEHLIDDRLKVKNYVWDMFKTYILGIFVPSFRTFNMRAARMAKEAQEKAAQAGRELSSSNPVAAHPS